MVYENLPIRTQHVKMPLAGADGANVGQNILVVKTLPTAILSVSRYLSEEAFNILGRKLYRILSSPPRMIVSITSLGPAPPSGYHMVGYNAWILARTVLGDMLKAYKHGFRKRSRPLILNLFGQFVHQAYLYGEQAFQEEKWQRFAPARAQCSHVRPIGAEVAFTEFERIHQPNEAGAVNLQWLDQVYGFLDLRTFYSDSNFTRNFPMNVFLVDARAEKLADTEKARQRREKLAGEVGVLQRMKEISDINSVGKPVVGMLKEGVWNESWAEGER
jgi:hypothetical protein